MVYLAILLGLLVGSGFLNIRFPFNYELYINYLFEKIEWLNPQYNYLKDKVSPILIKLGYNLLYGFSVCQIKINNIKNMLVPYLKRFKQYLKDNNILVEINIQIVEKIDKNGNIENMLTITDKTPLDLFQCMFNENSVGVILYDKNFDTECVNCVYQENMPISRNYTVSKISFMMVELEHENKKYSIELKNNKYNYYIVNNSLNQNFFKYYLKNVLKTEINEDNFEYNLTIIDHNVNFITINHHQYIVINEHGYKIYPEETVNTTHITREVTTEVTTEITTEITTEGSDNNSDSERSDDFVKLETTN